MIGIANVIPGVSGGTMAVSLGIYDRLLGSISGLFKHLRESITFLFQIFLTHSPINFIIPYIDSSVAIIVALFLVKEPIVQIIKNLKELVLFSPDQQIMDEIREVVNKDISNYEYSLDFLDVTQTGRKTWIEVYVKSKNDTVKIKDFKKIQEHITKDLIDKFDQIYVEIVPAL